MTGRELRTQILVNAAHIALLGNGVFSGPNVAEESGISNRSCAQHLARLVAGGFLRYFDAPQWRTTGQLYRFTAIGTLTVVRGPDEDTEWWI